MEHKRWIKRLLLSVAIATSIGLTACSSGSGGDAPSAAATNTDCVLDTSKIRDCTL